MKDKLNKIKKQSKKNNYTEEGTPRVREQRLQHRGASSYIESMGGAYTPSEAKKKSIEKAEGSPDKVEVGQGFSMKKLKESQKQQKTLTESESKELRGEILDSNGEETKLGKEVANKLEEMKDKKEEKFGIDAKRTKNALNSLWNISRENESVIANSYAAFGTEFGLYASIPMLCKGPDCVYAELYPELHGELTQAGERCPVEVALIMSRYDQYKNDLKIDPEDTVDMSILRDVIDYDVQIVRAENKIAIEGDFVKDVVVGVSNTGTEIMQEQITQASEYKNKIQQSRNKALNLLNSTRKDKAGEKLTLQMDPSSYTRDLLAKANLDVIDMDFEEINEEEDQDELSGLQIIEDEPYMKQVKEEDD